MVLRSSAWCLAIMILAICVPITIISRLTASVDERACLNQVRAGETVQDLISRFEVDDGALSLTLGNELNQAQADFARLDSLDNPTSAQKSGTERARKLFVNMSAKIKWLMNICRLRAKPL